MTRVAVPTKYGPTIIGSGGDASAAAIHANTLGKSVVMVERGTLGGTCVNAGCVPSGALTATVGAWHVTVDTATRFPEIATTANPVDAPALIAGKQALVESLCGEKYADVTDFYDWQILRSDASFVGTPDTSVLDVAGSDGGVETIGTHHYLAAAGFRLQTPLIDGLKETGYLTSATAMELTEVPEPLLVLGGGYVALERAQLFAHLDSQVTLLVRSRLASKEEPGVPKVLQEVFADEGIHVVSRVVPTQASHNTESETIVTTALSDGSWEFRVDQVLVALGYRPVTDGLNLSAVGVSTRDSGEVVVSDRLQSLNPRVWAAGDVAGHLEFVYVTAHHSTLVAENAFVNADRSVDYTRLPWMTFTGPAIGAVGMTKKDVLTVGIRCDCHILPLHHVPRALVNRDTRGFIRVVVNAETKEILGLTAVAKDAGELAVADVHMLGRTVAGVANAWVPYPTTAEGIRIAAKASITDPSLLSCCA